MDVAMGTDRSKALHNFTMPCDLRWGNQKFLRCKRVNSSGEISPVPRFAAGNLGSSDHPIQQRRTTRDMERGRDRDLSSEFVNGSPSLGSTLPPRFEGGRRVGGDEDGDEIAAIREKVIFDLQAAADKMKDAILKDGLEEREVSVSLPPPLLPRPPPPPPTALATAEGEAYRPWNLRTRRAACKMPMSAGRNGGVWASGSSSDGGVKGIRLDLPRPHPEFSQMGVAASAVTAQKSPMRSTDGGGAASSVEKREREKFSVPLSKREIEEDFFAMVGHRPPRRPKKRAKIVQKQLDTSFPGLWLTEVTTDMYKVPEAAQ